MESSIQFAFAIAVHGGKFTQLQQILSFCNILTASESAFDRAQKLVCPKVIEFTEDSCRNWQRKMRPGTIIAFDGSWSQRKNAKHCVVDFIDASQSKNVDFTIIKKSIRFVHGNYFGPSNGMEVEDLRRIMDRWRTDPIFDAQVEGHVHDREAKTRPLMRELWDQPEFLDANHSLKRFNRKLDHEMLPHGLKAKLRRWFLIVLKMKQTTSEKVRLRRNSVDH
jgi:hypothetical protein